MKPVLEFPCDLCGSSVQMSAGSYKGKVLPHYQMTLCRICYEGNWDGFAPQYERIFEAHLKKHNINIPARNKKGWYPR